MGKKNKKKAEEKAEETGVDHSCGYEETRRYGSGRDKGKR